MIDINFISVVRGGGGGEGGGGVERVVGGAKDVCVHSSTGLQLELSHSKRNRAVPQHTGVPYSMQI